MLPQMLIALACASGGGQAPGPDSSGVDVEGEDTGSPPDTASPWFEPDGMYLADLQAGWRGGAIAPVMLPEAELSPYVELLFATDEWFATGLSEGMCSWRAGIGVRGVNATVPGTWLRVEADLTLETTDCVDWDPDVWPGGGPTATFEGTPVILSVAMPTGRMSADFEQFADGHDIAFPGDWRAYVMGVGFAMEGDDGVDTRTDELAWGVVRAVGADGKLIVDDEGNAELIPLDGHLPEGAIRGYGFYSSHFSGVTGNGGI